ncbi:MAG TPA: SGNH/GDSL hydrolase family protein [Cytophagaceae bacterium]|jgi:lysophospholipase L1-like esterase
MKLLQLRIPVLALLLSFHLGYSQVRIFPTNPNILYSGRIDFRNPNVPKFNHSGSTIKAKFEGTSIALIIKGNANTTFNLIVDNNPPRLLKLNDTDTLFRLANNLSNSTHTVELIRRTETFFGTNEFLGFQLEQGKKLLPLARSQRRIEFIGNSITCGYGIEAASPTVPFTAETENVSVAFSGLTAKNFSAEQLTFCRSGIGIYRSGDKPGPTDDAMINVYDRLNMYDQTPKWDYNSFIPQVVVIDLGTNDFNGAGADSTLFTQAYESFVKRVRSNYPDAKIFAVVGPMMGGAELTRIKSYLTSMVGRLNTAGDNNVYFFELRGQGCCGFGSDYHPSVGQADLNAKELTKFIESKTDWKARPQVLSTKMATDGLSIEVGFDKTLTDPIADTSSFLVKSTAGRSIKVKGAVLSASDPKKVTLTLSSPIVKGETITLNYVEGTLKSQEGEYLATFVKSVTNAVVTNLTPEVKNSQLSIIHQNGNYTLTVNTNGRTSNAAIALYNLQGVKMATLFKGVVVGTNEISLNNKDLEVKEGIYIIKADLDGEIVSQKVYLK